MRLTQPNLPIACSHKIIFNNTFFIPLLSLAGISYSLDEIHESNYVPTVARK